MQMRQTTTTTDRTGYRNTQPNVAKYIFVSAPYILSYSPFNKTEYCVNCFAAQI